MKITNYFLSGDTHGTTDERLEYLKDTYPDLVPEETALIVLGDCGFNYNLDKRDTKRKKLAHDYGYVIYCVRGNHEQRPELIDTMTEIFDINVGNYVYYEPSFPFIRYFVDGYFYNLGGYKVLVIGGAYSVDKHYRIANGWTWFEKEMLDEDEQQEIYLKTFGQKFDFVLSHTCPYSWMPTDLFLSCVDQSTVDNSMEHWLDKMKNEFNWGIWCFGHFHADRLERPHVEQYFSTVENLDVIYNYWKDIDNGEHPYRVVDKSPNYDTLD